MYLLLVDDDAELVEMLGLVGLSRGHELRFAASADDALAAVAARRPDALILDLGLEGAHDGRTVLLGLRGEPFPIFLHTGSVDEDAIAWCRENGAREVFRKPLPPRVLFERIEYIVSGRL